MTTQAWTFPELFNVAATRVTDLMVLTPRWNRSKGRGRQRAASRSAGVHREPKLTWRWSRCAIA
jgi:hypothetical protein